MQGKKHNPVQIIKKLREADVMLAAEKTIGQVTQAQESRKRRGQHAIAGGCPVSTDIFH